MAMGIPVLHGVEGESAEIVKKELVGMVFEPENSLELVNKLLLLKDSRIKYKKLRANCLAAAKHYDRKVFAGNMLVILEKI
jgi:glycosyltransferase involved in cell wall biosynthesis